MTSRQYALNLVLPLALLIGQCIYVAHNHDEGVHVGEAGCEICLHSALFKAFQAAPPHDLAALKQGAARRLPVRNTLHTNRSRPHDSRAPPHI